PAIEMRHHVERRARGALTPAALVNATVRLLPLSRRAGEGCSAPRRHRSGAGEGRRPTRLPQRTRLQHELLGREAAIDGVVLGLDVDVALPVGDMPVAEPVGLGMRALPDRWDERLAEDAPQERLLAAPGLRVVVDRDAQRLVDIAGDDPL